jgi:ABC-2 type transport system permease protein
VTIVAVFERWYSVPKRVGATPLSRGGLITADLVYILLLGVGGVVFPLTKFPAAARPVLELLPTGALSTGLRSVLQYGVAFPVGNTVTLAVWAAVAIALAARTFRWE